MLMAKVDYVLDTNRRNHPKMITGKAMFEGLEKAVNGPFRSSLIRGLGEDSG